MKAILLEGGGGKWAIDLEFSPWSPRVHVLRTEGDTGTTLFFNTQAEAEAHIASMDQGEQAAIFKHDPVKLAAAIAEDTAKRKVAKSGK